MILTQRDKELICFIGKNGLASLNQLARKFWPGKKTKTCYERELGVIIRIIYHQAFCRGCGQQIMVSTNENKVGNTDSCQNIPTT